MAKEIDSFFKEVKKAVEPAMERVLSLNVDKRFQEITKYQIQAGGKRIRPAFSFLACRLFGGKNKDVLYAAAGLEILHNYTLIIDDIIDRSYLRRGSPTVWKKYGQSIAECISANYAAAIFQTASLSSNSKAVSDIFARVIKIVAEGEILDILYEASGKEEEPFIKKNRYLKVDLDDYLEMIRKKTASLISVSCEVGAMCAKVQQNKIKYIKNYGLNIGMAFQIQDDILDIFGDEAKFGKKIGKDIMEKKRGNIVVLLALEELKGKDKKDLMAIFKKEPLLKKDILLAVDLIKKTKAQEKSLAFGKKYVNRAKKNLAKLPQNKWNKMLELLADYVICRVK